MSRSYLLICIAVLAGLLAQPADARQRDKDKRERPRLERGLSDDRGGESTAAVAAEKALRANGGGRVLSVDRENDVYRVKVLKDGDVRTHFISVE
jgi:hypothetical protein